MDNKKVNERVLLKAEEICSDYGLDSNMYKPI
jgi:hypothetical protein